MTHVKCVLYCSVTCNIQGQTHSEKFHKTMLTFSTCSAFHSILLKSESENVSRSVTSHSLRPHGLSMEFSRQEYSLSFYLKTYFEPLN